MVTIRLYHQARISPTLHAAPTRGLPGLKAEVSGFSAKTTTRYTCRIQLHCRVLQL